MTELYQLSARDAVAQLKSGAVSPLEMIDAAVDRIEQTDSEIHALPTLCVERARDAAKKLDVSHAAAPGWLAGLPVAIKDLSDVAGVRTTYGSPIFSDNVPTTSDIAVTVLEQRGAVVLGKSNTPEFGAGANTFNEVFDATVNPWDTRLSAAGSSGGSAAALAAGQVWLATGSDLGGSLRTPASFCGVVGLRPSPGRVARSAGDPFDTLSVAGPMARDVRDVALFLDAMSGTHPGDPLSIEAPAESFQAAADRSLAPGRIAFTPDLGCLPVAAEVQQICGAAAARFSEIGSSVDNDIPSFEGAFEAFQTLRALAFVARAPGLLGAHRDQLKPEVIWNIEKGLALTPPEIARAVEARGALSARMRKFFETHDLLVCPAAQALPYDVTKRYVDEIDGTRLESYVDWIAITFMITLTGCPAISIPCGMSESGLPVGLQLIAPPHGEAALLSAAAAAEEMFGLSGGVPIDPRTPA